MISNRLISSLVLLPFAVVRASVAELPPPRVISAAPAADWNARFAGKEGWIGGDGVYSTALGDKHVLFLFGDTLVGEVVASRRQNAKMINNSVGTLPLKPPASPLRFTTGKTQAGGPASVLTPSEGGGWFWPQAAIELQGRLYIFLAHIEKSGEGPFGFKQVGQWLAVISNPLVGPANWKSEQHRLPFAQFSEQHERVWGSALLVDGDYLYIYGIDDRRKQLGSKQLIVARSPPDKLENFEAWQFRDAAGWTSEPAAASLAGGMANEFSVNRLPEGGFLLVYTESGLSDRIIGRVAAAPEGPWSQEALLYTCPEMAADKGVFSYAAKAHAWAVEGQTILVSYCVNAWQFSRLFADSDVYRPKFVRLTLAPP